MTIEHNLLTGSSLHEPKGADTAAAGTILTADGSGGTSWSAATAALPSSYINIKISNNTVDAVNDLDVSAGEARNDADTADMVLSSTLVKRLDAAWTVGTNAGGLDTGSMTANTTYHVFLIKRPDTGVVDALFSTSVSSPTMPSGYTLKRRIGSIKTNATPAIIPFFQDGDRFILDVPSATTQTNPGISAVTRTAAIPTGVEFIAIITHGYRSTSSGDGASHYGKLSALEQTDTAPSASNYDVAARAGSGNIGSVVVEVKVNTSAQYRSRISQSTSLWVEDFITLGWIDRRGKN